MCYLSVVEKESDEYDRPAVHDFESDTENATAELDLLEYPYNQEVSHRVVWTPFEDYLTAAAAADVDQAPPPASADEHQPPVAKAAPADDQSVDYPYNQDHGALLETYDILDNNGLWKEASEDDETDENEEDLGLIVDYPYNQLFGSQEASSEFPVLTGYYENVPTSERRQAAQNASSTPVEHTVHTVDLPDFDIVDLASPSPPSPRHPVSYTHLTLPTNREV